MRIPKRWGQTTFSEAPPAAREEISRFQAGYCSAYYEKEERIGWRLTKVRSSEKSKNDVGFIAS